MLPLSIAVSCSSQEGTVESPEVSPVQSDAADSSPSTIPTDIIGQVTIRLTNGEWPPYLSEDLEHYGVISRIVTEAFALEGIQVEYGFFPWIRGYELAKNGEWDGSIVWLRTPEREEYFYFSEPVTYCDYVFWHLKSFDFDWSVIEELEGITIGGTRGYFYEDVFTELERKGQVRIEWVSSDELNFEKLLAGRIDVYVQDQNVGCSMLDKLFTPDEIQLFTYHPKPLRVDSMHLILSKRVAENEHLLILFNRGLQRLRDSGKLNSYLAELLSREIVEQLKEVATNPLLIKHFNELAEAMRALYHLQQLVSSNTPALINRQILPSNVSKFLMDTAVGACFIPPTCFSKHFYQEFPDLNLISWTEPFPAQVIDRLRYLGNTARFKYCPTCEVCIDIAT